MVRITLKTTSARDAEPFTPAKRDEDGCPRVEHPPGRPRDWADPGEIDAFRLVTLEKHPTTTEYDSSGRVRKVTLPRAENETQETSITTSYNDPWEVTTLHSIGRGKTTLKNARGQVLSVEDFGQGDTGSSVSAKIGFCFDASGNRVKKMDTTSASLSCAVNTGTQDHSGNNEASWLYDAFGELRNSSDPDLGVSSFAYNAFGDLASSTDGKNQTTTYQYDTLGRMTQKTLPNGEGVVSYVYDNYSGSANAKGRLVAIDDPAQKKELSYDRLGHVAVETRYLKGLTDQSLNVPYITRTQYDLLDRVTQIDYPQNPKKNEGIRTCYGYNAFGVTNVMVNTKASGSGCSENQKTIVTGVQYNEFGQIAQQTQGNGVTTAYTYDIKGRMMRLVTTGDVGGTTKKFQDVSYTFNVQNSIKDIQNNATDYQTRYEYSYDGLNRLIAANGDYKETPNQQNTQGPEQKYKHAYDYAPNGNLTAKTIYDPATNDVTDQWTYAYDNHQAICIDSTRTGSGRIRMAYDAVGNMTSQINGAQNLEKEVRYNSQNRISRVINPQRPNQLVGQYWYDDQGFRVRKLARFDRGQGNNLEDVEILYTSKFFGMEIASAFTAVNNIYLNGVRVAAVTPNGGAVFYLTDQVDSVKLILDDNKAEVSRLEYLPYGETFVQKGNKDFAPKYNSQELDPETKFYFYNARYYDPEVARFTSADSVVPAALDTQAWNRFAYTRNNPIQYRDPTGHFWEAGGFLSFLGSIFGNSSDGPSSSGPSYSEAAGAKAKQDIDVGLGVNVDSQSGVYWAAYVKKAGGKEVSTNATGYQYFLVKDGWEGFMQQGEQTVTERDFYKHKDVSYSQDFKNGDDVSFYNRYRDHEVQKYDANDALVVFDSAGNLVGATQVLLSKKYPGGGVHDLNDAKGWNGVDVYAKTDDYNGLFPDDKDNPPYPGLIHGPLGSIGCVQASNRGRNGEYLPQGSAGWQAVEKTLEGRKNGDYMGKISLVGY